jgi:hypothetical protein
LRLKIEVAAVMETVLTRRLYRKPGGGSSAYRYAAQSRETLESENQQGVV